jgi:nucleoside-diphosphate-sugar epimerase
MLVLLTGSSGRLGRALTAALAPAHQVIGLDRLPGPCTHIVADLGDSTAVTAALKGVQAVLHTAALHAPHVGQVADEEFWRVNVRATRQLAERAAERGVQRFVFTSTTALYGAGQASGTAGPAEWVDEYSVPRPRTVYHHSKLAAEAELQQVAAARGLALSLLRMGRCFPEPAPAMALHRLHRGVGLQDVARAHALTLQHSTPGVRCLVLSGRTPFLRSDLEALGHDAPAVLHQRAPGLVAAFAARGWPLPARLDRVYAAHRAAAVLGWQAEEGFEAVLRALDQGAHDVLPAPPLQTETCPC